MREALRWLTAEDGAGLSVTQPADAPSLEVSLAGPRCSIIPPPLYVRVSKDFPRAETMEVLSRLALGSEGVLLLDVYRVPDRRLKPGDSRALEAFARANAQEWAAEGASGISSEIHSLDTGDGRTHVGHHIQYSAHRVPFRTFARWFIDYDGVLFRVGVCGPPHTPLKELAADARRAVETLRREDAPRSH